MLVKEYRISLPMSVEEYRIAQLYMIQRKSREESHGAGSGVEIITNQPYTDGPGGNGQYTYKIYHIGSHLPGWFRAILPKSALRVEEEAWNAYPYTKTRYRCPFVEKFVLEVETKYLNDGGDKDNIFGLTKADSKDITLDFIDIVKDNISSGDYTREEDPKIYQSKKTKRGPLVDNWREEYSRASKTDPNVKIMTAYKLCRVEFKYWGMQNKIERFIHDIGLRKTMLRAHRQAWCWQDEYYGLQLSDIRKLEYETQLALQEKMAAVNENEDADNVNEAKKSSNLNNDSIKQGKPVETVHSPKIPVSKSIDQALQDARTGRGSPAPSVSSKHSSRSRSTQLSRSKTSLDSSQVSDWRFQSLEQLQESSSDEDEFFDAQGLSDDVFNSDLELSDNESDTLSAWEGLAIRSSSMETLSVSNDEFADARSQLSFDHETGGRRFEKLCQKYSLETGGYDSHPTVPPLCKTNILFLVIHGGSLLDTSYDHFNTTKRSDYNTLKSTFDSVIKSVYPSAKGHVAFRLVPCPQICSDALNVLSSLSPFGFDAMTPNTTEGALPWSQEFVPLGAVGLFSACSPDYQDHVNSVIAKANLVFMDFLQSDEGKGFNGQVSILSDATGSILTYDALTRNRPLLSRSGSHRDSRSSDLNEDFNSATGSTHTLCETCKDYPVFEHPTDQLKPDLKLDISQTEPTVVEIKNTKETEKNVTTDGVKVRDKGSDQEPVRKVSDQVPVRKVSDQEPVRKVSDHEPVRVSVSQADSHHAKVKLHVTSSTDTTFNPARRTSGGSQYESLKFEFEVGDFFMLGSSLGLVLAYRKMFSGENKTGTPRRPDCHQIYNLFHASDPSAFRLEPLLNFVFRQIPPIKIARYNKFPMGDGESIQIVETVCHYIHMFLDQLGDQGGSGSQGSQLLVSLQRQASVTSTCSQLTAMSAHGNTFSNIANEILKKKKLLKTLNTFVSDLEWALESTNSVLWPMLNKPVEENSHNIETVHDINNSNIYVRKVVFSRNYNNKMKSTERVQNTCHACFFCGELRSHIQDHMNRLHAKEKEMETIYGCNNKVEKEKLKSLLRAKGDHKHNRTIVQEKSGELILFRRPTQGFKHEDFGPCIECYQWMLTTSLPKHLKTCRGDTTNSIRNLRYVTTMSDIAKGEKPAHASDMLIKEVFTIMNTDNIGLEAREDELICALGENWLKSCVDNKVKRAYWASQHMRLAAKLRIELRSLDDSDEKGQMWDYLRPAFFDNLALASLNICLPEFDDVEELRSPSNAIKMKYDLIRMLERKSSESSQMFDKTGDDKWKKFRKDSERVITDIQRLWKTRVTKLARKVLLERKLIKTTKLPNPKDIQKLGCQLRKFFSETAFEKENITWNQFRQLAEYAQARLLTYNKRRSGEIEGITIKNYRHKLLVSDLDEGLIGDITQLERHLMETHDLIQTRGKKSGIVPVLIPQECTPVLDFIADAEVRRKMRVPASNTYLFPKQKVSSQWWGNKRLDYMLYCPEVLHSFPVRSLPPLFHASFWESTDVIAFVLRQVLQQDMGLSYREEITPQTLSESVNEDNVPKEKWQKRRTMYKVRNLQPNHRGNDVMVLEDRQQVLSAKFMYGPLDMTSLSGEKTDIHVMSTSGEWTFMGTGVTDGHGRLYFTIPKDKQLNHGIYPVKMVVRVDHTTADLFLSVLPPRTETVIFSIDGSFTASVSIMGKDPKVKPGAVDVVRHWQELGYLILYVTARPDMQHNKVVSWLAQHNFPHGMVAFMDGFSKDPLKQKFNYLKTLQSEAELKFRAGYGSSKDINGYKDLGLSRDQIFIVGKSNKKQQNLATFISSGYAAHLELLNSTLHPGGSRPASGNAVLLLRKTCFCLPSHEKRASKHRSSNFVPLTTGQSDLISRPESGAGPQVSITISDQGNTLLQPVQPSFGSAVRARGTSPRPKMSLDAPR